MSERAIDINCDMGERVDDGGQADAALLEIVSSANVACGFHAGNPAAMRLTCLNARTHGVAVGAHPGLPDMANFGRVEMPMTPQQAADCVAYQLGAMHAFAANSGSKLQHIKLHGALYHMAAKNSDLAQAIIQTVVHIDPTLFWVAPIGPTIPAAAQAGLRVAAEFYADRAYNADLSLVSRSQDGAVIHDVEQIQARIAMMLTEGKVQTIDGESQPVSCASICVHSDTPDSLAIANSVRQTCIEHGVTIKPLGELI